MMDRQRRLLFKRFLNNCKYSEIECIAVDNKLSFKEGISDLVNFIFKNSTFQEVEDSSVITICAGLQKTSLTNSFVGS